MNGRVELRRLNAKEKDAPSPSRGLWLQHQRHRLAASSSSNLPPNDLVICATAYSHLSGFTRPTLLSLGCILVVLLTYNFSFDKGVREQMLRWSSSEVMLAGWVVSMKWVDFLITTKITKVNLSVKTVLLHTTEKEEVASKVYNRNFTQHTNSSTVSPWHIRWVLLWTRQGYEYAY